MFVSSIGGNILIFCVVIFVPFTIVSADEEKNCDQETGKCYCRVKGTIGDQCEECDARNHYEVDPVKKSCHYTLTTDYQYTFNLSKKEDTYFTQINFKNTPPKEYDADFAIICTLPAKVNITVQTKNAGEKLVYENYDCSSSCTELKFPMSTYEFEGKTTFFVNVFDYKAPLVIRVSFSQYPVLNLARYNITVATLKMMGIWNSTNSIVSKILEQEYSNATQPDKRRCKPIEN